MFLKFPIICRCKESILTFLWVIDRTLSFLKRDALKLNTNIGKTLNHSVLLEWMSGYLMSIIRTLFTSYHFKRLTWTSSLKSCRKSKNCLNLTAQKTEFYFWVCLTASSSVELGCWLSLFGPQFYHEKWGDLTKTVEFVKCEGIIGMF